MMQAIASHAGHSESEELWAQEKEKAKIAEDSFQLRLERDFAAYNFQVGAFGHLSS
jgi:hypothetical protein